MVVSADAVAVSAIPELVLKEHAHGVEHDQIERIFGLQQREAISNAIADQRVAIDGQGPDQRRPISRTREGDGNVVRPRARDSRVDLGLAVSVLPVEEPDAQHVAARSLRSK